MKCAIRRDYRWKTRAISRVSRHRSDDLRRAPALCSRSCVVFECPAVLIGSRAARYIRVQSCRILRRFSRPISALPDFSFLYHHVAGSPLPPLRLRGTWSTWKWTSRTGRLKNVGVCAHLVSFKRSFGLPPPRSIQLNSTTVQIHCREINPFGSRSVNRSCASPLFFFFWCYYI